MIDAFRRALADLVKNRYLHGICVLTIALSVFVVSAFGLFMDNAGGLMQTWSKGIRVIVYLEADVDESARAALTDRIGQYAGVDAVDYISRGEALDWLKQEIGRQSSLLQGVSENPLPDSLEIRLTDEIDGIGGIDGLSSQVASLPGVDEVEFAREWVHRFLGIYNLFKMTGLALTGLIFTAIMVIVANTIRLILYSRNEEIEITRIIGADEAFVKYPLYIEGLLLGLLGGVIGMVLLFATFSVTVPRMDPAGLLSFFEIRFLSPGAIVLILLASMLVGLLGCYFSVRKFLNI